MKQSSRQSTKKKIQSAGTPATKVAAPPTLLEQAQQESARVCLSDHADVIGVLRDGKGFTFGEIAAWLTERGVSCDHRAVYRVYVRATKDDPNLPPEEGQLYLEKAAAAFSADEDPAESEGS